MNGKYRTIVADPPWVYPEGVPATLPSGKNKIVRPGRRTTKPLPYPQMTAAELTGLPISDLAEPTGCRLFLWATNKHLPEAFLLLVRWGFQYRQTLVWHKLNTPPFASSIARNTTEFLLVANLGKPQRLDTLGSSLIAHGVAKAHSQKPDVFQDLIEQVSPGPYLELFARRQRLGWDTYGNEALEHVTLDNGAERSPSAERTA